MERIQEIETRMAEIESRKAEIKALLDDEKAEKNLDELTSEVDGLNEEVRTLTDEKSSINAEIEKRAKLEKDVITEGKPIENVLQKEERNIQMEKKTFGVDTEEYRNAYLKRLQGKELDVEERAAMTASAAIPTQTMNMIVGKLELNPLLAAIDITHIPGNISYPVESTVNDASWVAMATAATDSADALSAVSLGAYKLIKTISITADVAAMAVPAFEQWLTSRLANKINKAVDAAALTGTGTNQATGILTTVTSSLTFTKAAMTYKDLLKIIAALPTEYLPGASFVMPRALFYGDVLGMTETSGKAIVVADAQAPAKFNILGYPVIVDDNCTADNVIFGDLREGYKFNFAQDPTITADGSAEFRTGNIVYRAMALADGKVADANAFVVAKRATA